MPTDEKITQLTETTAIADADLFVAVQNVSTTPVTRGKTGTLVKAWLKTYFDTLYTSTPATPGRVEFIAAIPSATVGAPLNVAAGGSTPVEQFPYYEFVNGSVTYRDFLCRLIGYNGGGLTLSAQVLRTSAGAAATYIFEAALRRMNSASEDLAASQTYDFNAVTVTIPAGPPNAGIPMAVTITFTDGADMDSVADGEYFFLRFRRNGGTATDTARLLTGISMVET